MEKRGRDLIKESYVGKNFKLYNGLKFFEIYVSSSMVGRRFGEFILTRSIRGKKVTKNSGRRK